MKDEGAGIHALRFLAEKGIPENVFLIDAGTAFSEIVGDIRDFEKLIIVDAVHGGGEPGSIYCFNMDDVEKKVGVFLSLHEIGVIEALKIEKLTGKLPEKIVFLGIEPYTVEPGMELSAVISARMEKLLEKVLKEIQTL